MIKLEAKEALIITGDVDSGAAIKNMYLMSKVTYVTPGREAWLKFMKGETLPGIKALKS